MPEFEVTIKIKCTATAESADAVVADMKRKEGRKEELQRIVQEWMNEQVEVEG